RLDVVTPNRQAQLAPSPQPDDIHRCIDGAATTTVMRTVYPPSPTWCRCTPVGAGLAGDPTQARHRYTPSSAAVAGKTGSYNGIGHQHAEYVAVRVCRGSGHGWPR